ncbi:MAG: precorrin-2 C(20)-methyltransferase [Deltaproteobacteria bacterium]|nr:precorrin-2 C(20)-methyltransferase [Deltaproteobacteria bacterium]
MGKTGVLYGVGVGPGDAELMTRKAVRILGEAQVIAVPKSAEASADGLSKALSIAGAVVDMTGKTVVELPFPMTRDKERLRASRAAAASVVAGHLAAGRDAAFITLGDALLYSTFGYIVPFVKELLPDARVDYVPGITSFSAAAALSGMPLAESGERLAVIPAAYDMEEARGALAAFDTVVFMKVNRAIDRITALLEEVGVADRAVFVSRAGWPGEQVVTDISELKGATLDYFSLIIVRKGRSS